MTNAPSSSPPASSPSGRGPSTCRAGAACSASRASSLSASRTAFRSTPGTGTARSPRTRGPDGYPRLHRPAPGSGSARARSGRPRLGRALPGAPRLLRRLRRRDRPAKRRGRSLTRLDVTRGLRSGGAPSRAQPAGARPRRRPASGGPACAQCRAAGVARVPPPSTTPCGCARPGASPTSSRVGAGRPMPTPGCSARPTRSFAASASTPARR